MTQNEYFDAAAAGWDDNPQMVERSRIISAGIREAVTLDPAMKCLEIGAGTGRISFALAPLVGSILMADASAGMVKVLGSRIHQTGAANLEALHSSLGPGEFPDGRFDLVYSAMALHHVQDVPGLLGAISVHQEKDGHLVLVDLYAEDGSFHAHAPDLPVHLGFDTDQVTAWLRNTGYQVTSCRTIHEIQRPQADGSIRRYPLFMMVARRR